MAQSGALGFGPPWVGHVVGTSAPPPPRVPLPRPAPPPRPSRATAGETIGGRNAGEQLETHQVCGDAKGIDYPPAWDSPPSTASSSAYFSYSSTSSASPPPSTGSPPTPYTLPATQHHGRNRITDGYNPHSTQNHNPITAEVKKPTPAPRAMAKVERCEVESRATREHTRCPTGPSEEEVANPPDTKTQGEAHESYPDQGGSFRKGQEKSFRRPSEGTETSVIRRRATVEVRSVAVQTPSGLMTNAFDSRATYPRAKSQSHHWRANVQGGGPVTRSMDGEDGPSTSLAVQPKKKTSMPSCEWHCSFVGGDGSGKGPAEETADGAVRCDSQSLSQRGSDPSVDRRFDAEDVAAVPADSPEDVEREAGGIQEAKMSTAHQRVTARAELCPAPQVAYSNPQIPSDQIKSVPKSTVQFTSPSVKSQPNLRSQNYVGEQAPSKIPSTFNDQHPVNGQDCVDIRRSSVKGGPQSTPPSSRKSAMPPTPPQRRSSPQQSPKPSHRLTEPASPTGSYSKPVQHQTPSPALKNTATSTPKPPASSDPRHQSPLTHWLSELRSSGDAVEDEEGGVTMEEKDGRRPEEEVELRGGPRGPCERALNRGRRGSGGEISIYEDACSCLNGEWCCGDGQPMPSEDGKEFDIQGRCTETVKGGGGYKGIWGMDGAALDGGDVVSIRGGSRARGEGIEWRLSALGLKDNSKAVGVVERNKEETERCVNIITSSHCRRTISEGMSLSSKGKIWRELDTKENEVNLKNVTAAEDLPNTNGVSKKTSSNLSSGKVQGKTHRVEGEEDGDSPTSLCSKSPVNGKPPPRCPDVVPTQPTSRPKSQVVRLPPEEEEDWPKRSKFTEDDVPCDDGDGLIILPGTPEGHRSRVSQSDSFRSTTSSESKLSSASASSSSQEIPTTGGYGNNNSSSSGNHSAKSSSCDNVSLSSSVGEVSLQQRPPNVPPRAKPPRKNLKPKEPRAGVEGGSGYNAVKAMVGEDRDEHPSSKSVNETSGRGSATLRELCETPRGSPADLKPPSGMEVSGEAAVVSSDAGKDKASSTEEKSVRDKISVAGGEGCIAAGCEVPREGGKGRKFACPVAPAASPRFPPGKAGLDKASVASSTSGEESKVGRLSERSVEDPSDVEGASESGVESPRCGEDDEEEEVEDGEVEDEEEVEDGEEECDWKGVFVRGRRKGSYSSDIEAWKRGLSGWCSVEDEEEFLECTKFDPEDSSMYVGCGSPERSAEEWYSSNDMEGRVYFFEENSNESSWTLPEVSVVSPPQTPPPGAGVSGSPAGSDSFISGRSSGGEEAGSRETTEREGSGSGALVGVSRDDMVAVMPLVKMKMNQWEKGGKLIQLRDSMMDKELRAGRSTRAAKTRSMVIGDPGVGDVKILGERGKGSKDWPQLWDGNMYIIREGTLNKTKITENKKRVRKNWAPSHVVLTELLLLFFKDAKTFAAVKAGTMGGSISPGDAGAMPELSVDLNGALVDREDQLSSRRNVFRVSTVLGLQVLCQDDNAQNAEAWFQDISKAALKLPSGFDGSPRMNTLELRNYAEPHSPDEHKKFPRIGRSKSVKVKKDASMEDLSAANITERQVKIKARLKKFFHRRPTMESLVKKGIWKDEPAFGCYLEQVSGEGIPRIPLFVQRCIAAIESKPENMKADGLYRASGNLSQVQKIRLQVDQNNLSIVDMEEDVHVLTGALKLFFRELKEPLIPYSLFNRALTASTNANRKEQLHEFKDIVKILPVANYDTLKFLLQHLLRVTSFQEFNRMHIANLAIVFGPTLMWPKQESLNMALDLMQQNLVIECLLQEFDTIFSSGR